MTDHSPPQDRPPHSRNLTDSFRHALAGWWHALCTQRNARIHAVFTVAVLIAGLWLRLGTLEWALIVLAAGLVWVAELINTALEAAIDLASPDVHPLAKAGKDVSAAGVLAAAITAVLIGLLILGPPLWAKVWSWMSQVCGQ